MRWFWEVIREEEAVSEEKVKRILRACTGMSRVPIEGFKRL